MRPWPSDLLVQSFQGERSVPLGVVTISIHPVANVSLIHTYAVIEHLRHSIILGQDFLRTHVKQLNFKDRSLVMNNGIVIKLNEASEG